MLKALNFLIGKRLSIWHKTHENSYERIAKNIIRYSTIKSKIVFDNEEIYLDLRDKIKDKTILYSKPVLAGSYVIGNSKSCNIFSRVTCNHIIGLEPPAEIYYDVIASYDKSGNVETITYNGLNITDNYLPEALLNRIEDLTKLDIGIILNEFKSYKSPDLNIKEDLLKLTASNCTSIYFYTKDNSNINQYISQYINMLPKNVYLMCLNKHDINLNNNRNRCILTPHYSNKIINNLEDCRNRIAIPLYNGSHYSFIPKGDYTYIIGNKSFCDLTNCSVEILENKIQDIVYNNNSLVFNKDYLLKHLNNFAGNKIADSIRYCMI